MMTLFSFLILGFFVSLNPPANAQTACNHLLGSSTRATVPSHNETYQTFVLQDHLQTALSALATKGQSKAKGVDEKNRNAVLAASPEISRVLSQGQTQEQTVKDIYAKLLKTRSSKAAIEYIKEVIGSFEDAKITRKNLESYSAAKSQNFVDNLFAGISKLDPSFQTDKKGIRNSIGVFV